MNGNTDENFRYFFVTENGTYIALLIVSFYDGSFHSSFGLDENDAISSAIENNTPIALFGLEIGAVFIQTEYDTTQLTAFIDIDDIEEYFSEAFQTVYEKEIITLSDITIANLS